MHRAWLSILVAGWIPLALAGVALGASDTATHDVTVTLNEIVELEVTGGNITLTFSAPADPGDLPAAVTDGTTCALDWTSSVSIGSRAITAALSSAYTTGIVLKVTVTAPAGTNGSAAPQVTLSAVAQNVFTGVTSENCSGATLTYEASLTQMVDVTSETKTITYTLTDAS